MPISAVQQGILTELLFIILTVLGSDGLLEVARQATDDDRRDADVHRRGDSILYLSLPTQPAGAGPRPGGAGTAHHGFTQVGRPPGGPPDLFFLLSWLHTVGL